MISNLIIAILASLAVFCLFMFLLGRKHSEKKNIKSRMATISTINSSLQLGSAPLPQKKKSDWINKALNIFHNLGVKLQEIQKGTSFDLKMQQADWPILGSEFQLILLGAGAALAIVLFVFNPRPMSLFIGFFSGSLAVILAMRIRIQRRNKAFTEQLGDMLTMVANALRAGFSFMQALEHIAKEMDAPVSRELDKVLWELSLGTPLETALENMCKRVSSPDFELVVTAVLIQRQVGGNLAQILDNISSTINDRIRMRREIMTLTAQGRLSGIILGLLPLAVGLFLYFTSPNYLKPLFESDIGPLAIGFGLFLELIGFIVIKKIVDIEV